MTRVALSAFLQGVDAIADEKPSYRLGHDGSDGLCDCIGLIIGAIRRSGGAWNGIHGSNYAARSELECLLPLTDASDLTVGEVVFKAASPGQSNHNLPSRYANAPDQRDYYHVGVVRSTDPLRIVHCTGPGVVTDTKLGQWNHRGWLQKVAHPASEEESPAPITTAVVTAESGSTVNLRSQPGGALTDRIPVGASVTVLGRENGWSRILWEDHTGWMMDSFLVSGVAASPLRLTLPRETVLLLRDALSAALKQEEST